MIAHYDCETIYRLSGAAIRVRFDPILSDLLRQITRHAPIPILLGLGFESIDRYWSIGGIGIEVLT